ncbi:MAG: hypothetical protein A2W19_17160 [Spirochaetes bacterium RBG_16_49_21]|nr:MAG: hypothetical protein A2W19_17160 [Spirochaetes bacterium RBG_16_49_21]
MFDSKSLIVKVVSYAITGFFVLIIVISFGMPDFISRMGLDQSVIAIVNGEKVNRFDFLRYKNSRFGEINDRKMDNWILSYYIGEFLLYQEARKMGFYVTSDSVKDYIANIPGLRDPNTGRVDPERLNYFFDRISSESQIKREMTGSKFIQFTKMGIAVAPDEILAVYKIENSRFQIKYSFLTAMDLRNMYKDKTPVNDAEISSEMEKNKMEIKDPKTDRERIRAKLVNIKLGKIKNDIIDAINLLSLNSGSFDAAQKLLRGRVSVSKTFKAGERLVDQNGQPISSVNNSKIFLEEFMGIREGACSRVINTESGLYVFTPLLKEIKQGGPSDKERQSLEKSLEDKSLMTAVGTLKQKLFENAKKTINLKTDSRQ